MCGTYACWESLVLSQDSVNGTAESSGLGTLCYVAKDVVNLKVACHTLSDLPVLDIFAKGDDFSCHVRPRDGILLLVEGELAPSDNEVSLLQK